MTTLTESLSPSVMSALAAALCAAVMRITYRYRVQQTIRVLSALDDTALHDIGLDRGQITEVARYAATAAAHRLQR